MTRALGVWSAAIALASPALKALAKAPAIARMAVSSGEDGSPDGGLAAVSGGFAPLRGSCPPAEPAAKPAAVRPNTSHRDFNTSHLPGVRIIKAEESAQILRFAGKRCTGTSKNTKSHAGRVRHGSGRAGNAPPVISTKALCRKRGTARAESCEILEIFEDPPGACPLFPTEPRPHARRVRRPKGRVPLAEKGPRC